MRISDWSSDVCSSDLQSRRNSDPDAEGVIVTTTVRHLLSAAEGWHADGADSHFVIGGVDYVEDSEIGQRIVNACNTDGYGPAFFRTVPGRAESLLWKRIYFSHRSEEHTSELQSLMRISYAVF